MPTDRVDTKDPDKRRMKKMDPDEGRMDVMEAKRKKKGKKRKVAKKPQGKATGEHMMPNGMMMSDKEMDAMMKKKMGKKKPTMKRIPSMY